MPRYIGEENNEFPYSAMAYIEASFPDGTRVYGSGSLVGRNDILTSAHLVYDPAMGGQATSVNVTLGRDGSARPFGTVSGETLDYFEFNPRNAGFLSKSESQTDLAVVGLGESFGDTLGWLELAYFSPSETYQVTGYPGNYRESGQPRMMEGSGLVDRDSTYDVALLDNFEINAGSSGSPLWTMSGSSLQVMGVVSTKSWATLVEGQYATLQSWIAGNDSLIDPLEEPEPEVEPIPDSQSGREPSIDTKQATITAFTGLLEDQGWSWPEALSTELANTDTLRRFPELNTTLDPVIRLYTGMLGRTADKEGLEYWVTQLNTGNSLYELSQSFVKSAEFSSLVDRMGGGNTGFIDALYQNVLGRNADGEGRMYWLDTLRNDEADKADIALSFTDSEEYITSSYPLVQGTKLLTWGVNLKSMNPAELGFDSRISAQEHRLAESIVRLYNGVLDRSPDREGFEYWLEEGQQEEGLVALAENFLDSEEFLGDASELTADRVLDSLYRQVLDRAPDSEGEEYWKSQLQSESVTFGDLVLAFTESDEFQQTSQDAVDDYLLRNLDDGIIGVGTNLDTYLLG